MDDLTSRGRTPLHWPPGKFRHDIPEADQREQIQCMDIAGRARALFWGPYEELPPGLWRATARFTVDHWSCRHTFRLEWGATADFVTFEFRPGKAGIYEVSAERVWKETEKAELRIILTSGALGGMFELLSVDAVCLDVE